MADTDYIRKQAEGHTTSEHYYRSTNYHKLAEYLYTKVPTGRILDVGTNKGYEAKRLEDGGRQVVGIDLCKEFVEEAQRRGIEAYTMDFHNLKFGDEEFDGAYFSNGPEHSYDPERAFREILRVLKRGGVLVACLPSDYLVPEYKGGEGWDSSLHIWKPSPEQLFATLKKSGFAHIEMEEMDAKARFGLENAASKNMYTVVLCRK